jgi:DNA end-binding protein Ku
MRSTTAVSIVFGLVNIPVKLYVSASDESLKFNQITKDGNRTKQKLFDAVTDKEVAYDDLKKGYEFAKGQFVTFTSDELDSLALPSTKTITIQEFVPEGSVDPISVEKSYYVGPDKGGDKGYCLLTQVMKKKGVVAIAKWSSKGKEHLVAIRPHGDRLVVQVLFYNNEVRNFEEIAVIPCLVTPSEMELAEKLVAHLTSKTFESYRYEDEYAKAVKGAVEEKVAGKEISVVTTSAQATVVDLFDALKMSLNDAKKGSTNKSVKK